MGQFWVKLLRFGIMGSHLTLSPSLRFSTEHRLPPVPALRLGRAGGAQPLELTEFGGGLKRKGKKDNSVAVPIPIPSADPEQVVLMRSRPLICICITAPPSLRGPFKALPRRAPRAAGRRGFGSRSQSARGIFRGKSEFRGTAFGA